MLISRYFYNNVHMKILTKFGVFLWPWSDMANDDGSLGSLSYLKTVREMCLICINHIPMMKIFIAMFSKLSNSQPSQQMAVLALEFWDFKLIDLVSAQVGKHCCMGTYQFWKESIDAIREKIDIVYLMYFSMHPLDSSESYGPNFKVYC